MTKTKEVAPLGGRRLATIFKAMLAEGRTG